MFIGSSTLGEEFNPARDCSDIVDHLPGATDGFYWISYDNKTKHKVPHTTCLDLYQASPSSKTYLASMSIKHLSILPLFPSNTFLSK